MELKCKLCGKVVTNRMFKLHIKNQHSNEFEDSNQLEKFVIYERLSLTDDLVNEIIDVYVNSGETVNNLVERYGFKYKTFLTIFKINNVNIKGISDSVKESISKMKHKKTLNSNYGVDNPSKSDVIKSRKVKTFLKKYGVDNVFKDEQFKNSLNEIMLERYGVKRISGWFTMSDEQRKKQIVRITTYTISKLEKSVGVALVNLGINFTQQYRIGSKIFDYKLNDTKVLIEVNGDFWHGNPKKYKLNDLIHFPGGDILVNEIWEKDDKKRLIGVGKGYKILTIWENDIKKLTNIELEIYVGELLKNMYEK